MKTFRVLVIVAFLLAAAGPNIAQAAAGEQVGFIRLLSAVNANSSIQAQARRAYLRITPRLLALQKQGAILQFEPEFAVGVVKVRYVAGGSMASAMGGLQLYANIHDAMVQPSQAAAAAPRGYLAFAPIFFMNLYASCFSAQNLDPSDHVVGSMRDTTGRVVATYEGDPDVSGEIIDDCFSWAGSFSDVTPGYTVTFNLYDSTPALVGTYMSPVPAMAFKGLSNSTAVVTGTGVPGKQYQVFWSHPNWDATETVTTSNGGGTIGANRQWSVDLSGTSFRGGDELVYLELQTNHFEFGTRMTVPSMYCQLGSNYCELSGFAFQPAQISIMHGGVSYSFSGQFNAVGIFTADLITGGAPIYLVAGDRVSGTGVASYVLPTLTTKVAFPTNIASGKAPAKRYFEVWAYTQCGCSSYLVYARPNAKGNYSADFTSQVNLVNWQATTIELYYQDLVSGNVTDYFRSYGP